MRFPVLLLVPILPFTLMAPSASSLPDTGQTLCDNGSNVLATCTNANSGDSATYPRQDGRFGRDAKATVGTLVKFGGGAAGFDYTKVDNIGNDRPATATLGSAATDWACTRDNITGLTWEVKVNDASHLRDMNWNYTWYNSDGSTNGGNAGTSSGTSNCKTVGRCDTEKFVADVNASPGLCGNTNWRMPTLRELFTLVHAGTQNPSIDTTYFPNTQASAFWSGSSYVPDPAGAWDGRFDYGGTDFDGKGSGILFVRLVRGTLF